MRSHNEMLAYLPSPEATARLEHLYGGDISIQQARIKTAVERHRAMAGDDAIMLFSSPGRTELGGNHTDHQGGSVLAAAVNMDMLAVASHSGNNIATVESEGFPPFKIDLADLTPQKSEAGNPQALVRGIAAGITARGYCVSGINVYITSKVLPGSGLSSSAALEVLIGTIFNTFYCNSEISPIDIAQIGQYAENVFFEKPCGLMDPMACAVGNVLAIDFALRNAPVVRQVNYDFAKSGHHLCIIDSGADHADLTNDYAAITTEMFAVAAAFGCKTLCEVDENQFAQKLPQLRAKLGDRAVLRAMHFFADTKRAEDQAAALECGNFARFLDLVNASGKSSGLYLQNLSTWANPRRQEVTLAICQAERLLGGKGAVRVHGGGFAGTIQAFVPTDMVDMFKTEIEALLGTGCCHILQIRPEGGCVIF